MLNMTADYGGGIFNLFLLLLERRQRKRNDGIDYALQHEIPPPRHTPGKPITELPNTVSSIWFSFVLLSLNEKYNKTFRSRRRGSS